MPVTTHTNAADRTGEKQADIFEQEGLSPAMVCLGRCDDSDDMSYLMGLVKRGYTIGMDHISWGTRGQTGFLSWQQRAETIKKLVDAGFVDKIFMSHDWYFGISMSASGAMDVLDKMNPDGMLLNSRKTIPYLKKLGVSEKQIRTIGVDNPRRFFG